MSIVDQLRARAEANRTAKQADKSELDELINTLRSEAAMAAMSETRTSAIDLIKAIDTAFCQASIRGLLPGDSYAAIVNRVIRGAYKKAHAADKLTESFKPITVGIPNIPLYPLHVRVSCGSSLPTADYLSLKDLEELVTSHEAAFMLPEQKLTWRPVNFRYAVDPQAMVTWVDWDQEAV